MAETPEKIRLDVDVMVSVRSDDGVLDEVVFLTDLVGEYAKLISIAKRIVELDDLDWSDELQENTINVLSNIIKEAKNALGVE